MATVEYLQKRVAGKEAELDKLNRKLSRIEKAEASGWADNPYYYHERDKVNTEHDIEQCKIALEEYRTKLRKEQEKAESRNVKAILDFLAGWKKHVREYYIGSVPAYLEARREWHRASREHADWWNNGGFKKSREEKAQMDAAYDEARNKFHKGWDWLTPYMENSEIDTAMLDKDLQKEADAKYDDIIERTNAIVGTITDAGGLTIGGKGDLNGIIVGDKGKARVQTIGAGGYNIQCYHFRTLINRL